MDRSKLPPAGAPMLAHALAYAAQGIPVFPCQVDGKKPLTAHGFWDASTDTAQIVDWWTQWPEANLAMPTGAATYVVLDIDVKNGAPGFESFDALFPDDISTLSVATPSGGMHLYFKHPGHEVKNQQAKLGPGLDLRGDGGYVLLPPSTVDGDRYQWLDGTTPDPAPMPDALIPADQPTTIAVRAGDLAAVELTDADRRRLPAYGESAVAAELGKLGTLTYWNQGTYEVACNLVELVNSPWSGLDGQAVFDRFMAAAPKDAGFTDEDVMKRWQSAMRTVGDKARAIPPAQPRSEGAVLEPIGPDDPERFFGRSGLDAEAMAAAVIAQGPLRWGSDDRPWAYRDGVWSGDRHAIERRVVGLLRGRFRNGHASTVATVVRHRIGTIEADPVPEVINFPNGLLDWRTGVLRPHDPEVLSTVQMGVPYRPDDQCPQFDAFLAEVLSPDYVKLAWEMIGYLMYSGNPLQVAFMLVGPGGNGKGTLLRVVTHILGRANVSSASLDSLNTNRFAAVTLFGKLANIAGDIDATYQESTAAFKKLTGEDLYQAEHKGADLFTFANWAVPVFSANRVPGSADTTEGYLRRWVVLEFPQKIQAKELGLSERLAAEGSGIANHAIRSLREALGAGRLSIEGDAAGGRERFNRSTDQARQWLDDEAMPAPDHWISMPDLYASYVRWAERNGAGRLSAAALGARLESIGFPLREKGHVGLNIKTVNYAELNHKS